MRNLFTLFTMLVALPTVLHAVDVDSTRRPNVLFIISDDQERREFNFLVEGRDDEGKPRNFSPSLDRLAAEGVVFPTRRCRRSRRPT